LIYMLSADICRLIMKEQPAGILSKFHEWSANSDELVISAITYAELVAAALLTSNQERHMSVVQEFCDRLEDIVPWDRGAVDCYTTIQLSAMQKDQTLNMNDAMVAAHALSLNATLLTQNPRPFSEIPEISLQIWPE
jgi:tRNA(fMet)-specific endonuclease VapC